MKDLAFALKKLCQQNPQGSFNTRKARARHLALIAQQLEEAGYTLKQARSLKPKHIEALIARWHAEELAIGTIKNRLAHIRWWAQAVNKASIVQDNEAYGISQRVAGEHSKAKALDTAKLEAIPSEHVVLSLRLQAAFGLRREEAIKFIPDRADHGDHIILHPTWTKGGKKRRIPILKEEQREVLDRAKKFAQGKSMIPEGQSYIKHLKTYENQTLKAGLNNNHGLRHHYAQTRYGELTGWPCPHQGGKLAKDMTREEWEVDHQARLTLSEELGHGRKSIMRHYLGGAR